MFITSLREARRVVSGYTDSCSEIVAFYNDSLDTDSDEEVVIVLTAAQVQHQAFTIAERLYDEYLASLSSALIRAPELLGIQWDEYSQVLVLPGHEVSREDLLEWRERVLSSWHS